MLERLTRPMTSRSEPQTTVDPGRFSQSWIAGGAYGSNEGLYEHFNPATGASIGRVEVAGAEAVDHAVAAARAAQPGWAALSKTERARIMMNFSALISRDVLMLAELEALEVGRPCNAAAGLIAAVPEMMRRYAGLADQISGDLFEASSARLAFARRRPRGVVAAIVPWNVPVLNVLIRAVPALMAGNTVVVKPSEYSPRAAVALAMIATEAGLPDGAFNVVIGLGQQAGQALAEHPGIDFLTFTGSTASGMAVTRASAMQSLKPVAVECGGKSAQILLDDIFEDGGIWPHIFVSAFWNSGQWCAAKTRLLVPASRLADTIAGLRAASSEFPVGDPFDPATALGPLANRVQHERVERYFEMARSSTSYVELDCPNRSAEKGGCFALPGIATEVPDNSPLLQEEIFGPLLSVQTFETVDDAIRIANSTNYGLSGALWTNDAHDSHKVSSEIVTGSLAVYSSARAARPALPDLGSLQYYEPQRQSGFGADGGLAGLHAYTTAQAVAFHN